MDNKTSSWNLGHPLMGPVCFVYILLDEATNCCLTNCITNSTTNAEERLVLSRKSVELRIKRTESSIFCFLLFCFLLLSLHVSMSLKARLFILFFYIKLLRNTDFLICNKH